MNLTHFATPDPATGSMTYWQPGDDGTLVAWPNPHRPGPTDEIRAAVETDPYGAYAHFACRPLVDTVTTESAREHGRQGLQINAVRLLARFGATAA